MWRIQIYLIVILGLCLPSFSAAFYSNDTFFDSYQAEPAWFQQDDNGGFFGETVDGFTFAQKSIVGNFSGRIQKFSIGEAYFYVSDKGIIIASGDLSAISIYLSIV